MSDSIKLQEIDQWIERHIRTGRRIEPYHAANLASALKVAIGIIQDEMRGAYRTSEEENDGNIENAMYDIVDALEGKP